jgi:hypothetical protein
MRTIASTFETRDEAESATRRLQGIGVAPDQIMLKDLGGAGARGEASGFFVSAKVTPEQVDDATKILKRFAPAEPAPLHFGMDSSPRVRAGGPEPSTARPRPAPAAGVAAAEAAPAAPAAGPMDRHRIGRRLVIFGLVLTAAFVAGAVLGLVT